MFRQRKSSAKPGDELLANFRQQFPEVSSGGTTTTTGEPVHTTLAGDASIQLAPGQDRSGLAPGHDVFDQDPTPRASAEPWRFTPSLLDPESFSFSAFANQPPGYYTPTPGGTNTLYHPQAGDLHTPTLGLGMGLGTPLSLPTSDRGIHVAGIPAPQMMDMSHHQFHPGLPPQHFQQPAFNPFIHPAQQQQQQQQQQPSFAPSTFIHQDTGYETMDQDGSPLDSDGTDDRIRPMDAAFHHSQSPPLLAFPQGQFGVPMQHALPPSAEKFRFHCTLNAPTAMIKHLDEIPVTYLNKGQAYSLSIIDTAPTIPMVRGTKYRTFVRISFEDDQQRQKPGVCWSLWKEGRGTNEAHQRGGKLQAVEYVEQAQPSEIDNKRTRVELESASFDGFCVAWTPGANGMAECNIAVRFNFLSTDFSHSKGVKGIPVRLCAKTTALTSDLSPTSTENVSELCYSKVKLFRDHGAERKLANDVAHVKKSIDKLKQQIAQAESGMKDFGKRKRGGGNSQAKGQEPQRPGKVQKHKRTWSMSSASSAGGGGGQTTRPSVEDDMHLKLQALQDMFTSTRPVSILYLRGEELDDPDLHPVALAGEPTDLTKIDSKDAAMWQSRRATEPGTDSSVLVSPSPSSLSLQSQQSAVGSHPWENRQDRPARVATKTDDDGNLSGWIEALGVDPAYQPPVDRPPKPIACFYVARPTPSGEKVYHRAIYLAARTLDDFILRTASKWSMDATTVSRALHVLDGGLEIEMDDDVIRELSEGQAMTLEVREVERKIAQPKREWEMAVDAPDADKASTSSAFRTVKEYEFRFNF